MFASNPTSRGAARSSRRGSPCSTPTWTTSSTRTTPTDTRRATSCSARSPGGSSGRRARPIWSRGTAATSSLSWSPTCRRTLRPARARSPRRCRSRRAGPGVAGGDRRGDHHGRRSVGIALYPTTPPHATSSCAGPTRPCTAPRSRPALAAGRGGKRRAQVSLTARMQLALERGELRAPLPADPAAGRPAHGGRRALIRWDTPKTGSWRRRRSSPWPSRTT